MLLYKACKATPKVVPQEMLVIRSEQPQQPQPQLVQQPLQQPLQPGAPMTPARGVVAPQQGGAFIPAQLSPQLQQGALPAAAEVSSQAAAQYGRRASPRAADGPQLPVGWVLRSDGTRVWYEDTRTGATSWTPPPLELLLQARGGGQLPMGWVQRTNGVQVWFEDERTGVTQWARPV